MSDIRIATVVILLSLATGSWLIIITLCLADIEKKIDKLIDLQTKARSYWTPISWEMPGDIDGSTWHRDHFESWAPQMGGKEKQGDLDEE